MAKWTSGDFIKELQDISRLNEARKGDAVVSKLVDQLKEKMNHAGNISATTLIQFSEAIAACSFGDGLKASLQEKVDDLTLNGDNNGTLKVVSKGQMLRNIYNYLSVSEVEQIRTAPLPTAVQICVQRLKKVGVKSMKEVTKKPTCAYLIHLLLVRGEPQPTAREVYKLAEYFATSFQQCQQKSLVAGVAVYPPTPAELGQDNLSKRFKRR